MNTYSRTLQLLLLQLLSDGGRLEPQRGKIENALLLVSTEHHHFHTSNESLWV